tara:strand:- start:757 stop:933 length:177 start_codon:yes stop_codon:yes gene_type:complete
LKSKGRSARQVGIAIQIAIGTLGHHPLVDSVKILPIEGAPDLLMDLDASHTNRETENV